MTLYVRNKAKLPYEIIGNELVSVMEGTLEDIRGLERAVASGPTVFVSFAGPSVNSGQSGTVSHKIPLLDGTLTT